MRAVICLSLFVLLTPAAALAQGAPATPASASPPAAAGARRGGADISRDEYIERAKQNAEKRFDRMDTNHDGILSRDERRAARAKRRGPEPADATATEKEHPDAR